MVINSSYTHYNLPIRSEPTTPVSPPSGLFSPSSAYYSIESWLLLPYWNWDEKIGDRQIKKIFEVTKRTNESL